MFSQLNELSTNDRVQFLPDIGGVDAGARRCRTAFALEGVTYAVVVFEADEPIDELRRVRDRAGRAAHRADRRACASSTRRRSSCRRTGWRRELVIPVEAAGEIDEAVTALRTGLADVVPEGLQVYVTGPAGFTSDIITAFQGIDGLLLLVALARRAAGADHRVPVGAAAAHRAGDESRRRSAEPCSSSRRLARSGVILLAGQTQGILLILVIGATTNYALLYISRYTEALARHRFEVGCDDRCAEGLMAADPRVGRDGDRLADGAAHQPARFESHARPGRRDRHRVRAARSVHAAPGAVAVGRQGAFWPRHLKSVAS